MHHKLQVSVKEKTKPDRELDESLSVGKVKTHRVPAPGFTWFLSPQVTLWPQLPTMKKQWSYDRGRSHDPTWPRPLLYFLFFNWARVHTFLLKHLLNVYTCWISIIIVNCHTNYRNIYIWVLETFDQKHQVSVYKLNIYMFCRCRTQKCLWWQSFVLTGFTNTRYISSFIILRTSDQIMIKLYTQVIWDHIFVLKISFHSNKDKIVISWNMLVCVSPSLPSCM